MDASIAPRQRSSACHHCRARHLKCRSQNDDSRGCTNCIISGRICEGDVGLRFKHGCKQVAIPENENLVTTDLSTEYGFHQDQPWPETTAQLVFVDETVELSRIYGAYRDSPSPAPLAAQHLNDVPQLQSTPNHDVLNTSEIAGKTPASIDTSATDNVSAFPYRLLSNPWPAHTRSRWGLQSLHQTVLMQHFVQVLASWFDIFDPDRHFALHVPCRAANSSILRDAIFALSARHLSIFSESDPYLADVYHEQCIETLMKAINEPDITLDENMLCAMGILRLLEELEVTLTGCDNERHLRGIQVFISEQKFIASTSEGLPQAAFWACLHQEVFTAFSSRRAISPALSSYFDMYFSLSPADDRVWAYRILVNCAHVLAFCYGSNQKEESYQVQKSPQGVESLSDKHLAQWKALYNYTKSWHEAKPYHFEPIFASQPTQDSTFPITHYHLPAQLAASMYYYVCVILLTIHNPVFYAETSVGSTGDCSDRDRIHAMRTSEKAVQTLDEDVRSSVRIMCGIALSNCHLAPAMTMASTAVAICGDYFVNVDQREKEALLEVMRQNEERHGWPTTMARQHLKNLWTDGFCEDTSCLTHTLSPYTV